VDLNGQASRSPRRLGRAPSSEPVALPPDADELSRSEGERTTVHYYFPVEIEVLSTPENIDPEEIVERTLRRLAAQLEAR
jgi:hypothetical protein